MSDSLIHKINSIRFTKRRGVGERLTRLTKKCERSRIVFSEEGETPKKRDNSKAATGMHVNESDGSGALLNKHMLQDSPFSASLRIEPPSSDAIELMSGTKDDDHAFRKPNLEEEDECKRLYAGAQRVLEVELERIKLASSAPSTQARTTLRCEGNRGHEKVPVLSRYAHAVFSPPLNRGPKVINPSSSVTPSSTKVLSSTSFPSSSSLLPETLLSRDALDEAQRRCDALVQELDRKFVAFEERASVIVGLVRDENRSKPMMSLARKTTVERKRRDEGKTDATAKMKTTSTQTPGKMHLAMLTCHDESSQPCDRQKQAQRTKESDTDQLVKQVLSESRNLSVGGSVESKDEVTGATLLGATMTPSPRTYPLSGLNSEEQLRDEAAYLLDGVDRTHRVSFSPKSRGLPVPAANDFPSTSKSRREGNMQTARGPFSCISTSRFVPLSMSLVFTELLTHSLNNSVFTIPYRDLLSHSIITSNHTS